MEYKTLRNNTASFSCSSLRCAVTVILWFRAPSVDTDAAADEFVGVGHCWLYFGVGNVFLVPLGAYKCF